MYPSDEVFSVASTENLVESIFLRRINRFLVECELNGSLIKVFLPNPGRLWELLFPGSPVLLSINQPSRTRATGYTLIGIKKNGTTVMLNTHTSNHAVRWLLKRKRIPSLVNYHVIRQEYTLGKSRFDFLLQGEENQMILEVKSCSLFGKKIAMFPDAPSKRAVRHVSELAFLGKKGYEVSVLFLVHSSEPDFFLPEYHTDPLFAEVLFKNRNAISIRAVSVSWDYNLFLNNEVKELEIPWNIYEQDSGNRGCYMVILELKKDIKEKIGNLGDLDFRKGFYIYVQSAEKNLDSMMDRHRRKRTNLSWHIDYLRAKADIVAIIPIRTADNLECALATAVSGIAEWSIPCFGTYECNCFSHLFGMSTNPLNHVQFIDDLIYFRIDRLEKLLGSCS